MRAKIIRTSCRAAWMCAVLACAALAQPAGARAESALALERVLPAEPFAQPVHVTYVPDGSGEMAVVEQDGIVKLFHPQRSTTARVLMDIRPWVSRDGMEEGLLSIAFHPDFGHNGRLYVYYSAARPRRSVVAQFHAVPGPDGRPQVSVATGEIVLEISQPYANHNGGLLLFGPDGMLYIGLGDGGSAGDPHGNGQNRRTLLGSILRIDVDHPARGKAYGIPPDNPFVAAGDGSRPEIWAYGLRNPWRFSFDRETGALFAADVGQNRIEEVDRIEKGGNYGWNIMEGRSCFKPRSGCSQAGLRLPISEYTHLLGTAIVGGFVYRGRAVPGLRGRYIFADFGSGTFWSIPADTAGFAVPATLLSTRLQVSSFGEDAAGELYVTDWRGAVYRLVPAP